jgi:hypothetical protein
MTAASTVQHSESIFSKRRLGWAGLLAIAGCAAVCALPALAAALLGASAAAALVSVLSPAVGLGVGGLVFVVVLGAFALRARTRKASALRVREIPIVCDPAVFSKEEREQHVRDCRKLLIELPLERRQLPDGYLFHYQGSEELFVSLARWAAEEHRCCSWARFSLEMEPFNQEVPGKVRLSMTGGTGSGALLAGALRDLETSGPGSAASLTGDKKLSAGARGSRCGC